MASDFDDPASPEGFDVPGDPAEFGADGEVAVVPARRIRDSASLQFAASIVVPGVAAVRRAPLSAAALLTAGMAVPMALVVWAAANRDDLIGFALDEQLLTWVIVIGVLAVLSRVAAVAEVAASFRGTPRIRTKTSIAAVALIAIVVPSAIVLLQVNHTRDVVGEVFSSGDDTPLFESPGPDDESDDDESDGDVTEEPSDTSGEASDDDAGTSDAETTDVDEVPIDPTAIRTTLLLGGDDGPGRWGSRTDSMILFLVDENTGRSALVSVPRNLMRLRFPPDSPLGQEFPDGFDDLANAVFTHVRIDQDLIDAYPSIHPPEVVALTQGIGYSLGITIDDYVLVNMQAFKDVVDAVGGVTVDIPKKVLVQRSNPVGDYEPPESLGPGRVELDGTLALAYVRARRGDSDYFRMARQRDVLAALGAQVSTSDAIMAFPQVADALDDSMKTSLSSSEFSSLLDRLGDSAEVGETVGLAPPLIIPSRPDFDEIRSIVDDVTNFVLTGQPSGYDS